VLAAVYEFVLMVYTGAGPAAMGPVRLAARA
jgi:hypothetical protein